MIFLSVSAIARVRARETGTSLAMRIQTKILAGFTLSIVAAAGAGAAGIVPLLKLSSPEAASALNVVFSATIIAVVAIAITAVMVIKKVTRKIDRFRRDVESIATGEGESLRIVGDEL